ncbi:MAG: hypothetical protein RR101_14485 [Burkholderiaceae bacterium]
MTALKTDRLTPARSGECVADPVAAGVVIFAGAMVSLDTNGHAVSASATGKPVRAVAAAHADNTGGAAGAIAVDGRRGIYRFENSSTAALARTDIGAIAVVEDNQTVKKAAASNETAPAAGLVIDLDDSGVWIEIR